MTELRYNGKTIGIFRDDKTFITQRNEDSHLFRKFNGLGISYKVLLRLKALNCKKIVIIYTRADGLSEMLITTPEIFTDFGFTWAFDKEDIQTVLPLKHFNQDHNDIDFRFYSYKQTTRKQRAHINGNATLLGVLS